MNAGASFFLIVLLLLSSFVGLGYLLSNQSQLASENQGYEEKITTLGLDLEAERSAKEATQTEVEDLENRLDVTLKALDEKNNLSASLQSEIQDLQQRLAGAQQAFDTEHIAREEMETEIQRLQNQFAELSKGLDTERAIKDLALKTLESERAERMALLTEVQVLRAKLDGVKESDQRWISWMSNPLVNGVDVEGSTFVALSSLLAIILGGFVLVSLKRWKTLRELRFKPVPQNVFGRLSQSMSSDAEVTLHLSKEQLREFIKWKRLSGY